MDTETLRMLMPKPYEPRDIKVNKEPERALRKVKHAEKVEANRSSVIEAIGWECISCLCDAKLIEHARSSKGGEVDRIERTIDGRNYFRERRRKVRERYGTVVAGGLIGGVFTIVGTLLGFWLATSGTSG